MQNSETAATSSNVFDIKVARERFNFEEKDKKGFEHICYGDKNGGAHMVFIPENLESKTNQFKEELLLQLEKSHTRKIEAVKVKLKNSPKLDERLSELLKKYKQEILEVDKKVANEIKKLENQVQEIAKNKKANTGYEHNNFPENWGPGEIKAAIINILQDVSFSATKVEPLKKEQPEQAGKKQKHKLGPMWEINGNYTYEADKEIKISVLVAQHDKEDTIKIISAFPEYAIPQPQQSNANKISPAFFENKIETQPNLEEARLPRTPTLSN